MAHIVPSISYVKNFRRIIERGVSVSRASQLTLEIEKSPLASQIYLWMTHFNESQGEMVWRPKTHYQLSLREILRTGLQGGPIYEPLLQLEEEMVMEFEVQWKAYLESLPMRLTIPMLLLFFPAYVVLLFGPLVTKIMSGV